MMILCSLGTLGFSLPIFAESLLDVFKDALQYDPTYQKAGADYASVSQNIPITFSYLLPQLNFNSSAQYTDQINRGTATSFPGIPIAVPSNQGTFNYNSVGYTLNLTQTIFNYAEIATFKEAKISVKAAQASYAAALQDLMRRTAQAYFDVLSAEDNLRYIQAEKKAIKEQLDQVSEQYKVGVVAITGVYQAQAAYDSIISQEIAAANNVINQRENLKAITGKYYNKLDSLKNNVKLISPTPADPSTWVKTALKQNLSLVAARYTSEASKEQIAVERAGNYPVVGAFAQQNWQKTGTTPFGTINLTTNEVGVQLNLPIYEGGLVHSETKQATYNYQSSKDVVMQTYRSVYNNTEQSYNNVVSELNQVKADRQAIISNASSLRSTIEGFKVGTQTMLDVLQAQENLYNAESLFSHDQYAYVNATVALKQAAGTLNYADLAKINVWLAPKTSEYSFLSIQKIQVEANKNLKTTTSEEQASTEIIQAGGNLKKIKQESLVSEPPVPNVPDNSLQGMQVNTKSL